MYNYFENNLWDFTSVRMSINKMLQYLNTNFFNTFSRGVGLFNIRTVNKSN